MEQVSHKHNNSTESIKKWQRSKGHIGNYEICLLSVQKGEIMNVKIILPGYSGFDLG
ncbi:hypothetical protein HanIR_Chr01g0024251 [Helianthus annuus]|nr:hypothetical protein HanIR_Chr01g0024251 [Helianthus annuus]